MKRNCYLDIRFRPSSPHHSMNQLFTTNINKKLVPIPHAAAAAVGRHMLDVTELQARVIIWLASQEMEGGSRGGGSARSLSLQSQALLMHAPQPFSIKTSLRNFLHKRKKRSRKSHPHH